MKKIIVLALTFTLLQCSSGDSEFSSIIFPAGLTVSSPTTNQDVSSSSNNLINSIGAFDSTATFAEKRAVLERLASGDDECTFVFPNFTEPFNNPNCYGPKLYYNNHPDGPDEAPIGDDDFSSLPGGDLGIWTENDGSQACAAGKLNTEIGNVGQRVDAALLFIAGISCLIESDGDLEIPEEGSTTDLTTALASAIEDDNPAITINDASLQRLSDSSDGFEVFQYTIEAENSSGVEISINLKHHPTNSSGSNYKGKLWTSFESDDVVSFGPNTDSFAFTLLYEREEDNLNFQNISTAYNVENLDDFDQGLFDSNNNIDPTACGGPGGANCWEDFSQTIGNIDTDTGYGTLSYGWQAGRLDSDGDTPLARIFNFYTSEEDDAVNAYAFFGFGRGFNRENGDIGSNTIDRFICNWAGPGGNDRAGKAFEAQKQVMTFNESSGLFESDSANITYSPSDECDYDSGSGTFAYSTENIDLDDEENESGDVTNNLVDLMSDTDYANYTAPTKPTEDF